jgi:hypothetical protein
MLRRLRAPRRYRQRNGQPKSVMDVTAVSITLAGFRSR